MRSWSVAAATLLVTSAQALPEIAISKRDRHTNGATNIFARGVSSSSLLKRAGIVTTNIFDVDSWSLGGAYYANITVGTPPQTQTVILDTGSSDLYFDASSASTCQLPESNADSCQGGTYDLSSSHTYKEVAPAPSFNTSFGDGSTAEGPYGSDVVGIGDVVISNVQFGVASTVNSTTGYSIGLMGVGYSANEAVTSVNDFYPNMPEVLVGAGVINSRLYSVYLNDAEAISGTILFGGIDKSKYTGDLVTVDLLPVLDGDQVTDLVLEFITTVTAAETTVNGKNTTIWSGGKDGISVYTNPDSNPALPVLLDTGSTAWSLPQAQYGSLAKTFPYIDNQGTCSCAHASSGDYVTLEFAGKVSIKVDASQFIVPYIDPSTKKPIPYPGTSDDTCVFLITPGEDLGTGFQTLGDAVLRSMYVVFDLDNGQVSIAQANVNSNDKPDVVTVQAGASGVAQAASISTAAPNSFTIAPTVSATNSFVASTAASTIGTATGEAAIPTEAQVVGDVAGIQTPTAGSGSGSSSGSGSGSSSSSPSPSKGAASGLVVPGAGSAGFWVTGTWIAFAALGAGLMM